MTERRTPVHELMGKSIDKVEIVDGGVWHNVVVTTTDGYVLTFGGYKGDAGGDLCGPDDDKIHEWDY